MSTLGLVMAAAGATAVAAPPGQQVFTTVGTTLWTVPAGVTSVCMVAVQPGGTTVPVTVKNAVGGTIVCRAQNGSRIGTGGGDGGAGYHGGGGAGGYSGNGGRGQLIDNYSPISPQNGAGGGGGGGGAGGPSAVSRGGGGGVGLLGQGSNGVSGLYDQYQGARNATGGSGGSSGAFSSGGYGTPNGGAYGGGAGWLQSGYSAIMSSGGALSYLNALPVTPGQVLEITIPSASSYSGPGAVRIIWGAGRAFPSTLTGNL